MKTQAVTFDVVSASRGTRRVLEDVSLSVGAGETVALVGRSGSGKTTLLRLVNRLLDADAGRVLVDGRDVREWDAIALRRRTGYVIQDAGLFPHVTVGGNIGIVPKLLEWTPQRIADRVDELLALVGLAPPDYRDRWPDELSGGERQRVGLARALAADPPLLLMDEPFGALDPITKSELHAEFRRVQATLHRSVILVTHDMAEAFVLADRIAVLHDGRVIACAPGDELRRSGDPRVNALLATRAAAGPEGPAPRTAPAGPEGPAPRTQLEGPAPRTEGERR